VILKWIFIVLALVLLYRMIGGKLPSFPKNFSSKNRELEETLVECATCGTYVTLQESLQHNEKHYCSKECASKA